jgi:hypothetical protein
MLTYLKEDKAIETSVLTGIKILDLSRDDARSIMPWYAQNWHFYSLEHGASADSIPKSIYP